MGNDAMLALNGNHRFDSGTTQVYLGSRVPVRVQVTRDELSRGIGRLPGEGGLAGRVVKLA